MSSLVKEIQKEIELRMLQESIPRIIQCLNTVNEEHIWYIPNSNSNSMGNLILHLCGNVRQYLIASIGGKQDDRKRDLEFSASGLSRTELMASLEKLGLEIKETIPKVTLDELERVRNVQGFNMSGISVVIHVIEHFSYHTGQIAYMTKLLKDVDLKFYGDLDLNVTGD
jgi:uncharacterized damage-inducible protein DinB